MTMRRPPPPSPTPLPDGASDNERAIWDSLASICDYLKKLNIYLQSLEATTRKNDQPYTVENLTTDRTYDADATATDELADVLGTLLVDLGLRRE